jgi:hypothetical protein
MHAVGVATTWLPTMVTSAPLAHRMLWSLRVGSGLRSHANKLWLTERLTAVAICDPLSKPNTHIILT